MVVTVRPSDADPLLRIVDRVRYSSYGVPWRVSLADVAAVGGGAFAPDGQITVDDLVEYVNWYSGSDPEADLVGVGGLPEAPDGTIGSDDVTAFSYEISNNSVQIGPGTLSVTHSRKGYAGYEWDPGLELASRGKTIGGSGGAPTITLRSRSLWRVARVEACFEASTRVLVRVPSEDTGRVIGMPLPVPPAHTWT